ERIVCAECGAPAVPEQKSSFFSRLSAGDTVRIREGKQQSGCIDLDGLPGELQTAAKVIGLAAHVAGDRSFNREAGVGIPVLPVEHYEAQAEIGLRHAGLRPKEVAFGEQGGDFTGKSAMANLVAT